MKPVEFAPSARKELRATGLPAWERDERLRKFVVDKFPYAIFYREQVRAIEVVAIAHIAREPAYWVGRT